MDSNTRDKAERVCRLLKQLSPSGNIAQLQESLQSCQLNDKDGDLERRGIDVRESLSIFESGNVGRLSGAHIESLEAIIHKTLRPAIFVVGNGYVSPPSYWSALDEPATRARLGSLLPSIGRIELPGKAFLPYAGTGFVVGKDLVMTNRHVAQIFAERQGDRRFRFKTGFTPVINFKREHVPTPDEDSGSIRVLDVVFIHAEWDVALLRVEGLTEKHQPLSLSCVNPLAFPEREVVVVGYPMRDTRGDIQVQDEIFRGVYGVKRLLPGFVCGFDKYPNQEGQVLTHDASTLGGSSGSAVIHVASGQVLALHVGGTYLETTLLSQVAKCTRIRACATVELPFPTPARAKTLSQILLAREQ